VLAQYPAEAMVAWPVSPRVNSPRNDSAELIEPFTVSPPRDLFS
jgi:putative SOS response-associated peptidase YedK